MDLSSADPAGAAPASAVPPLTVLNALVRCGRWSDAADYAPFVEDLSASWHAALLLAADRVHEAHELLAASAGNDDADPHLAELVNRVDDMYGHGHGPGQAISSLAALPGPPPVLAEIMVHAARHVGEPQTAAHFARSVLGEVPADPASVLAVAADLVDRNQYAALVGVLNASEPFRHADDPDPLDVVLDSLDRQQARALVTIGRFLGREVDPTVPVSDAQRSARRRWRAAYTARVTGRGRRLAARLGVLGAGAALAVAVGNALPAVALNVAVLLWLRNRPMPGLDVHTSRLVRAVNDPLLLIKRRRYSAADLATFVLTIVLAGAGAAALPKGPDAVTTVEIVAVIVIAAAATRGRRRWVRRERTRIQAATTSTAGCRCLDLDRLFGPDAQGYARSHLFHVGVVPAALQWNVLQCLPTHTAFVDVPAGSVLIRLASS